MLRNMVKSMILVWWEMDKEELEQIDLQGYVLLETELPK